MWVDRARIPQIVKNYRDKSCDGKFLESLLEKYTLTGCRTRAALLFAELDGQCDIWSKYSMPLHREGLRYDQPPVVNRLSGNNGRRCDYLRPIQNLFAEADYVGC
jgi:hypothetical protein